MLSNLNEIANRVCELIPEGYEIIIRLSKDSGFVVLEDNAFNEVDYPSNNEYLNDSVEDALQYTIDLEREENREE
jgi:hypothetical protein